MRAMNISRCYSSPSLQQTIIGILALILTGGIVHAQVIHQYNVQKTSNAITIDGKLTEPEWVAAPLTEKFVKYTDGAATRLSTQAKFLWDDQYLYIGFICEDPDVWATLKNRDDHLWNGEVVEMLCDPDGDGLNYFEAQVNPLGTLLDLLMNKLYSVGGQANLNWTLNGFKAGIWVDGTLNDSTDIDTQWCCEVALPFKELAFMGGPILHFPPVDGETWRILVTRYDYERTGSKVVEVSSWDQTDSRGFHVPEKFGRITFVANQVVSVEAEQGRLPSHFSIGCYPNPFNPSTTIEYNLPKQSFVTLKLFDLLGREVASLVNEKKEAGNYSVQWDASQLSSGVYFYRWTAGTFVETRKMILMR